MNPKQQAALELVKTVCGALLEKKALDVRVLDVSAGSSITDTMIVASGTSDPHLRALRIEADRVLSASRAGKIREESSPESGWTVIDAFDLIIHLLTEEQRERYRLEHLWKDAEEIDVAALLAPPAAPAKPKRIARTKEPRKAKAAPKSKAAPKARSRKSRKK